MLPLSNILDKFNPSDKEASWSEFYLSLVINDRKVKSALWSLNKKGEKNYVFGSTETWGKNNVEDLIIAADTSIAAAVAQLPHPQEKPPGQVILGLPAHWIENDSINKDKQDFLREVCRKLELKPLGFVVTPEGAAHYLKNEEGGMPAAILLNLSEEEIIVSLITEGKFQGSKIVGRSNSLALDLEEGLLRFNYAEVLPNRILIIPDGAISDLEEQKRNLVTYPWISPAEEKKLNFLQLPKVEVVDDSFEIKAVVTAGCHELGLEKGGLVWPTTKVAEKIVTEVEETPTIKEPEEREVRNEEIDEEKVKESFEERPHFRSEVVEAKEIPADEEFTASEEPEVDFGFVEDEDILSLQPALVSPLPAAQPPPAEEEVATLSPPSPQSQLFLGSEIFKRLKKIKISRPHWHFPYLRLRGHLSLNLNKKIFWGLVPPITALFLLGIGFWGLAKAEVKIQVQPQKIDKEFDFTVSSKISEVDVEKMILPVRSLKVKVSDSKTADVLGKKTVGERAVGEVVIYNRTEQIKNLPKGTKILGPGGLKFVLAEEVSVASKTADLQNGVDKWGEAKAKVEAADIGAQYNIAADSPLTFESLSSSAFLIKNPTAFAGGTSREIQAVTKADQENLQKALLAELIEKARAEAESQLAPDDFLVPESIKLVSQIANFDHALDDEASSLSLTETAEYSVNYLKKEDFEVLAEGIISQMVPSDYQKQPSKENNDFSLKDKEKGVYTGHIREEFLPKVEFSQVPSVIKGKTLARAQQLVGQMPHVAGLDISFRPQIFSFLRLLPFREQNIAVVVETL